MVNMKVLVSLALHKDIENRANLCTVDKINLLTTLNMTNLGYTLHNYIFKKLNLK